jgi:hypothetical protein
MLPHTSTSLTPCSNQIPGQTCETLVLLDRNSNSQFALLAKRYLKRWTTDKRLQVAKTPKTH